MHDVSPTTPQVMAETTAELWSCAQVRINLGLDHFFPYTNSICPPDSSSSIHIARVNPSSDLLLTSSHLQLSSS
jgi:hypothetical protein